MLTSLVNQPVMLQTRSSLRRRGAYGYIGTSQTMAYLSSCGFHLFPPPLLWLYPSPGPAVLHRPLSPSPHPLCASVFFPFFCLLPLGIDSILRRTKEIVAMTEKEKRQLGGYGVEIVLHLFSHNTVCTSLPLCPRFFLSPSPHPYLYFDCFTFFQFLLCSWFLLSLLLLRPSLSRNSVCQFLTPHPAASLSLSLSFTLCYFFFSCLCLPVPSTMWSEPLQWIISQLTHRGQPKPPVQT